MKENIVLPEILGDLRNKLVLRIILMELHFSFGYQYLRSAAGNAKIFLSNIIEHMF
jgi:hypothetical protein